MESTQFYLGDKSLIKVIFVDIYDIHSVNHIIVLLILVKVLI